MLFKIVLLLIISINFCTASSDQELDALCTVYKYLDDYQNLDNWSIGCADNYTGPSSIKCKFDGIECNYNGHVSEMFLHPYNGTFDKSFWFSFPQIKGLYFFSDLGSYPECIFPEYGWTNLTNLKEFSIVGCHVNYYINDTHLPLDILHSESLTNFGLGDSIQLNLQTPNYFPSEWLSPPYGPNIEGIALFGNNLYGEIPINFINYPKLVQLMLFNNDLHGEIPIEYFTTNNKLSDLYLDDNKLWGSIPKLSTDSGLKLLSVDNNILSGNIDSTLWNQLTWLEISFNELSGDLTSISVNHEMYFDAAYNNFTGTIDDSFCKYMTKCNLSGNDVKKNTGVKCCKF
ncbi:Hypothetical protein HVR_LOCUS279 [uncultured virus]|nr:Hypothetical protein HVR_LOCUS279 [uncultured virus]